MSHYQGTAPYAAPPDVAAAHSGRRAWRLQLPDPGARGVVAHDATVGGYIVYAGGVQPAWSYWIVMVMHLRPLPGVVAAAISRPGATHELDIVTLDPREPLPALTVSNDWRVSWLSPLDVDEQFAAADDAHALEILDVGVRAVVAGAFAPADRSAWRSFVQELSTAPGRRS